jgi:glycosyltransferase involved in cell wall biosynthesis
MSPKVSVVVVTYNHAGFIDGALESALRQDISYPFEVIVSEDFSNDGTRDIVCRWQTRFPSKIRLLLSETNLKSNEVVRRAFHAARGQYVALLDGDDAWTSQHKLARQVALMDADTSISLCQHNARVVGGTTRFGDLWTNPLLPQRLSLSDLWDGNPFATCGSLFRRSALPRIPDWYCEVKGMITDWPLYILFAEMGDVAFMPDAMGVYRLHEGGSFSPLPRRAKLDTIDDVYRRVNIGTGFRHDRQLRRGRWRYYLGMARAFVENGEPDLARACIRKLRRDPLAASKFGIVEAIRLEVLLRLDPMARA